MLSTPHTRVHIMLKLDVSCKLLNYKASYAQDNDVPIAIEIGPNNIINVIFFMQ